MIRKLMMPHHCAAGQARLLQAAQAEANLATKARVQGQRNARRLRAKLPALQAEVQDYLEEAEHQAEHLLKLSVAIQVARLLQQRLIPIACTAYALKTACLLFSAQAM